MALLAGGIEYDCGSLHGGGALRYASPELIDPDEFGCDSSRPTEQSDIFSFACTAFEVKSFILSNKATSFTQYFTDLQWSGTFS